MGMGGMSRERKVKGLVVMVSCHSSVLALALVVAVALLVLALAVALALLPPLPLAGAPPLVSVVISITPPNVDEMMLDDVDALARD